MKNEEQTLYESAKKMASVESTLMFCNYGLEYIRAISCVIFENSKNIKLYINNTFLYRQDIAWRLVECMHRGGLVHIVFHTEELLNDFNDSFKSFGYAYALKNMELLVMDKNKEKEYESKFFIVGDDNKLLLQTTDKFECVGCFNNEVNGKRLLEAFDYMSK